MPDRVNSGLGDAELTRKLSDALGDRSRLHKVLLLPPDYTRLHSDAGRIVRILWGLLTPACEVDIMPALGSHAPMTEWEWHAMFGDIPYEIMLRHDWRHDVVTIGELPGELLSQLSHGYMTNPVPVQVNRRLLDPSYDLILSIGQVVPHEVVGMANRNKNIFVGCGGSDMINASHMLGAFCGLESIMGHDHTPVRDLFDEAEAQFLGGAPTGSGLSCTPAPLPDGLRPGREIPLSYILTVTTASDAGICLHDVFIGRERCHFEQAVALAAEKNMIMVDRPFKKCVVRLDADEFKSTWLGNKAVYRTRMAMADGGELIILAPGVKRFGEDDQIDVLIRKYGYHGREKLLALIQTQKDLAENLSAAAHMIHGSSDGRFSITYCTRLLSEAEVRGAGYNYLPYDEAVRRYPPEVLKDGMNDYNGEEIFYVSNPALGLWAERKRFETGGH